MKAYKGLLAFILSPAVVVLYGDVTFTDGTFNLAGYTQTATGLFGPAISIGGVQCSSCGDPGNALQITAKFGDTTTTTGSADLGFVNNAFSYNPSVNGAIVAIDASVDKDLNINVSAAGLTDTFRPLIEQDGNYYLAAIHGPTFSGGDTGFLFLSQSGLTAADFLEYDFSTGTFSSGTPNFAGDPMLFGLGQISSIGGFSSTTIIATYDNLQLDLHTVPEPNLLLVIACLCAVVAGYLFRRRTAE